MFEFTHVQLSIAASNTPFTDHAISEKAEAFIEFRLPDTVGAKNVLSIKLEASGAANSRLIIELLYGTCID